MVVVVIVVVVVVRAVWLVPSWQFLRLSPSAPLLTRVAFTRAWWLKNKQDGRTKESRWTKSRGRSRRPEEADHSRQVMTLLQEGALRRIAQKRKKREQPNNGGKP